MKRFFCLMATLLPVLCDAQLTKVTPLTVGDSVPDIVINNIINYKDTRVKLSDFKGKLVILDFWSVGCAGCIKAFPKLDSLQNQFRDQIQIVLITTPYGYNFGPRKVADLLNRWQSTHPCKFNLPVATSANNLLRFLFPYEAVPHYVWISSQRVIVAMNSYKEMNAETIRKLLEDQFTKN